MWVNVTAVATAFLLLTSTSLAQTQSSACGPLENAYGPYDYRTDKAKLPIVLGAHFTPEVEALIRGATSTRPGHDIDYTLRAIPNNPRALYSMMQLGKKENTDRPSGSHYSVECWFDRAIRFRPDDQVVRMLYSTFLANNARKREAEQQLEVVLSSTKDNPFTHYNVGLVYFDLGEYGKALAQAHKAIDLGFTRPELRDKLQVAGKWEEPRAKPDGKAVEPTASGSAPQLP
jgi:tetratricopeptide (TPR) repeat protein